MKFYWTETQYYIDLAIYRMNGIVLKLEYEILRYWILGIDNLGIICEYLNDIKHESKILTGKRIEYDVYKREFRGLESDNTIESYIYMIERKSGVEVSEDNKAKYIQNIKRFFDKLWYDLSSGRYRLRNILERI